MWEAGAFIGAPNALPPATLIQCEVGPQRHALFLFTPSRRHVYALEGSLFLEIAPIPEAGAAHAAVAPVIQFCEAISANLRVPVSSFSHLVLKVRFFIGAKINFSYITIK